MFFERCEQGFRELIKFKTSNGCYRRGIVFLARFQRGCWTLVTINNTEKKNKMTLMTIRDQLLVLHNKGRSLDTHTLNIISHPLPQCHRG